MARRWPGHGHGRHPARGRGQGSGRGGRCGRTQYVKRATVVRRSLAIRDSSSTAWRVWLSAWVVEDAAVETPTMLLAISVDPPAASCTDRDISLVVAVCSSTALAMVSWK